MGHRIILYPFFSQQDKQTGKFNLMQDSGVKLYAYMAEQMRDCGWEPVLILPPMFQCDEYSSRVFRDTLRVPYAICLNNGDRRLQWDPVWIRQLAGMKPDLVLTQHEFLAYVFRMLTPDVRTVMECGIKPTTAWPDMQDLFYLSWRAATAIHCNSKTLEDMVKGYALRTWVWQFAFSDHLCVPNRDVPKTVDVLFNARASSTNYSNHELFIEAMRGEPWKVLMTDPTNYLRANNTCATWLPHHPLTTYEYELALRGSKVVVGLTENGYGGYAFREAIATGCVPVALDSREYHDLLGPEWPYYCSNDVVSIRIAVSRALAHGWNNMLSSVRERLVAELDKSKYSNAWKQAKRDMESIL